MSKIDYGKLLSESLRISKLLDLMDELDPVRDAETIKNLSIFETVLLSKKMRIEWKLKIKQGKE